MDMKSIFDVTKRFFGIVRVDEVIAEDVVSDAEAKAAPSMEYLPKKEIVMDKNKIIGWAFLRAKDRKVWNEGSYWRGPSKESSIIHPELQSNWPFVPKEDIVPVRYKGKTIYISSKDGVRASNRKKGDNALVLIGVYHDSYLLQGRAAERIITNCISEVGDDYVVTYSGSRYILFGEQRPSSSDFSHELEYGGYYGEQWMENQLDESYAPYGSTVPGWLERMCSWRSDRCMIFHI